MSTENHHESERPTRPAAPAHGSTAKRRLRKALVLRQALSDLRAEIRRTVESFDVVRPVCSAEERGRDDLAEFYLALEGVDDHAVRAIDDLTQAVTFACGDEDDFVDVIPKAPRTPRE